MHRLTKSASVFSWDYQDKINPGERYGKRGTEESDLEEVRTYLRNARESINDFFSAMG